MPASAKRTLAKIMMIACPSFVCHRWQYRYDVLCWICEREQLLSLLDPASVKAERESYESGQQPEHDFTDADVETLCLLYANPSEAVKFWCLAYTMRVLCRWGHTVVGWLHGCFCHSTKEGRDQNQKEHGHACKWSGRRLIELASGAAAGFVAKLRALSIEHDSFARKKLAALRAMDAACADRVIEGFATSKKLLEARFVQLTSFVQEVPWCLVKLIRFLVVPPEEMPNVVSDSRCEAKKLLADFTSGKLFSIGDVGRQFLENSERNYKQALYRWSCGMDCHMNCDLFRELVSYASSLLVMQTLESRHHLVHVPWIFLCCNPVMHEIYIILILTPNVSLRSLR